MPSRVSGKPVDSSGSMTPAADGSSAQLGRRPALRGSARRGAWTNGSVGSRRAELSRTDGSRSSSRVHAGAALAQPQLPRRARSVTAAPALVMPLLKRSIQIHPPGNTWCTAASSTGYGGVAVRRHRARPSARRPRSACRAPASAAATRIDGSARPSALGAGTRAARWRRSTNPARTSTRFIAPLALEHDARPLEAHAATAPARRGSARPRARPRAPASDRSRADTSACRRSRRAGSPRPAAAARARRRPRSAVEIVVEEA